MCSTEYENLVSFLKEKKIKILNLQSEQVSAHASEPFVLLRHILAAAPRVGGHTV